MFKIILNRSSCESVSSQAGMPIEEWIAEMKWYETGRKHHVRMIASTKDTMTFQVTKAR